MASQFATSLLKKIDNLALVSNRTDMAELTIDGELQEVREVLEGLLGFAETEGDDQSELCQRARDVMEKLRV